MAATEMHTPRFEAESEAEFWERTEEMALRPLCRSRMDMARCG